MKINQTQIHRFKRIIGGYIYPITNGVYLAFNDDLTYRGIEMFYNYGYTKINKVAEEKLEELIAKDLIEIEIDND